jgi:hypothetical protein
LVDCRGRSFHNLKYILWISLNQQRYPICQYRWRCEEFPHVLRTGAGARQFEIKFGRPTPPVESNRSGIRGPSGSQKTPLKNIQQPSDLTFGRLERQRS